MNCNPSLNSPSRIVTPAVLEVSVPSIVAVMIAVPALCPVTTPSTTLATLGSDEVHTITESSLFLTVLVVNTILPLTVV